MNSIVRLNSDGSIDPTFNAGNAIAEYSAWVRDLAVQADGKILLGGTFARFNGESAGRIFRLHSDGSIDQTFNKNNLRFGFDAEVESLVIQPDGKILVAGRFTKYNNKYTGRVVRLMKMARTTAPFLWAPDPTSWPGPLHCSQTGKSWLP